MIMKKIPEGYKQTEIGVIPSDWDVKVFGDIVNYVKGFAFKSKDYKPDGIRIIRVSDTNYDSIKKENAIYVDEKRAYEFCHWKLDEYDLIFSTVGSKPPMYDSIVGKVILIKKEFAGSLLNQNAVLIRAKDKTRLIQELLLNHFRTKRYLQHIEEIFRGNANQASITLKEFFKYKIPLPKSKIEQIAIANILSDTSALIENLEKLITKKKAVKQGAMQQLLTGKKRLPGFSGEWEVKTLGEIGKFKGGSGFPIKYQGKVESKYPFYKVSDMNNKGNQTFMRNSNNWINESTKKIIGSNVFPEHTIVFAKIGAAIYLERKKILFMKSCIDNNMMGFIFDESQSDYRFLHYLFLSIQLGKLVSATALPSLNGKQIAELSFAFPRKKEQTAIATILSDMDVEIESLEQKRDKYIMLKQGMMQQLLTGRIRIYANN